MPHPKRGEFAPAFSAFPNPALQPAVGLVFSAENHMATSGAPYFMMVTFEIEPQDEPEFNRIYDTDHIPNLLRLDGLLEIIRFRDAERNAQGRLVYSALYLLSQSDYHETTEWKEASEIGRWAPDMRPRIKSRQRRAGTVAARFNKAAS